MRRVRRIRPEERFLNGMLLFVALALIVVGVWRMGTEPRAGSTEVKAERLVSTTTTSRARATHHHDEGRRRCGRTCGRVRHHRRRPHHATSVTVARAARARPRRRAHPLRSSSRAARSGERATVDARDVTAAHDRDHASDDPDDAADVHHDAATTRRRDRGPDRAVIEDAGQTAVRQRARPQALASYMAESARSRRWSAVSCGLAVAIPMLAVIDAALVPGLAAARAGSGRRWRAARPCAAAGARRGTRRRRAGRRSRCRRGSWRSGPRPRSAPRRRARGRGGR